MKVADILEGKMKRSDPWISGERSGPRTEPLKLFNTPKRTALDTRIANLAKQVNASESSVRAAYQAELHLVDNRLEPKQRYSTVWSNVKRRFGAA